MYIVLAILAFGILIASHEFGHFAAAKACGVRVNEYSIGMGPALFKKQKGETLYSLRLLPIGGYCAMEGEDEESGDPRSFTSQAVWKKLIILAAGAFMNFIFGLIVIILLYSNAAYFASNNIDSLVDGFKYGGENGLMEGDEIVSIDGKRIFYADDFSTYMSRSQSGKVDMVIRRNGEKIKLKGFDLAKSEYVINGETVYKYGITFGVIKATPIEKLKYSFYTAYDFVRLVELSFVDLFNGRAKMEDISGVVGIVGAINDVGQAAETTSAALNNIAYLCAFIAICLAVTNLLPIPALDGGRIFLLIVTWTIEKITGKHIDPKYEGYIHGAGMILLMGLMVVVMYFDITKIIRG